MNDLTEMAELDWQQMINLLKTIGVEFGFKLVVAVIIFYVGRLVSRMLVKGLRRLLQSQQVDKILETFVCNPPTGQS